MITRMNYGTGRRCGADVNPYDPHSPIIEHMTKRAPWRSSARFSFITLTRGIYDLTPPGDPSADHILVVYSDGTAQYEMEPRRPNAEGIRAKNIIDLPGDRWTISITEQRMGGLILFDVITYIEGDSPYHPDERRL